jgi:hypothetical protein
MIAVLDKEIKQEELNEQTVISSDISKDGWYDLSDPRETL